MQNIILVNSHRRSGTHFLIDYLRKNILNSQFPNHRHLPADFNIGSLFSKNEKVFRVFKKFLQTENIIIVKSHLLPEEMDIQNPKDKFERLIKEIFENSIKLYIYRDGKDVLVSLYHFLNTGTSFEEFLKSSNDHIPNVIRSKMVFDENRVIYWAYHVKSWNSRSDVHSIEFTDLKNNHETSVKKLLEDVGFFPISIHKPSFPNSKLLHAVQKKMNHFGLIGLPESSSVRPRKGVEGDSKAYFSNDIERYFEKNVKKAENILKKT